LSLVCKFIDSCNRVVHDSSESELKAKCFADIEDAYYEQNCCHNYLIKSC